MHEQNHACPEISCIPKYPDDWSLIQDCLLGDRRRWAELIQSHERTLFFAVLNTLRSRGFHADQSVVEDIQADVAVELVKNDFAKLKKYSGRCRLAQWLKVVASNFTIDFLRKQRPSVSLSGDSPASAALRNSLRDPSDDPHDTLEHTQNLHVLRSLFNELNDEDHCFVELFYTQERSFEEIADIMDTSIGAIYARKNRVRKKLTELASSRGLFTSSR